MTSISQDRSDLIATLDGNLDLPVHAPYPSTVQAPCLVVLPGSLSAGTAGSYVVRHEVVCIVMKSKGVGDLDALVGQVVLATEDWALMGVDPYAVPNDRPDLLVATVHLASEVDL